MRCQRTIGKLQSAHLQDLISQQVLISLILSTYLSVYLPILLFLGNFLLRRLPPRKRVDALPGLEPELADVPPVGGQVLAELLVLVGDRVLADVGQAEEGEARGEDAQRGADEEGVLVVGRVVRGAARRGDVGEHVDAYEGADLADGCGDAVILSSDAGGAGPIASIPR